ncbi:beta-ketoacyl-ACP reductase [Paraburkholderia nodosa]|uniref:beta-ketoacyl-ACP reductase n=1 Tax=Paraburkholderia nodosa TaxID=392320 RepID=UPI00084188D9|nr:beta-ketoacyl-ACP reductase [Paraburkholderia nodosa]
MATKRVAFVTGGMGGLGEAISRRLHDAGMTVAVSCSAANTRADAWVAAERAAGREFGCHQMNVADYEACERAAQQALDDLGQVDVLINNAGITCDRSFVKMSKSDWDSVLRTDLDALFNVTKPFLPGMIERGFGRIINIGSVNGSRGAFGQTNYSAAKAGMHGFTKALALEVAKKGVTVNTVSPGYLATQMVEAVPKDVLDARILPQIPVGRLGQPNEVAALVAFLCSDDAAFITGADIAINGGMHMQ